jgi:ketopantoate hydroxymethyltransferase
LQKKIFEANIDTETIADSFVHANVVVDLPFVSFEQKKNFEKKLGELIKDAVEVIKIGIKEVKKENPLSHCNCDICTHEREQKLKGGNPVEKSRFRFW